jgi:hypothetical protein
MDGYGIAPWKLTLVIVAIVALTYLSLRPEMWSQSSGQATTHSVE